MCVVPDSIFAYTIIHHKTQHNTSIWIAAWHKLQYGDYWHGQHAKPYRVTLQQIELHGIISFDLIKVKVNSDFCTTLCNPTRICFNVPEYWANYWALENILWELPTSHQMRCSITVWCGIWRTWNCILRRHIKQTEVAPTITYYYIL